MSEAVIGARHPSTCEMPECSSQEDLVPCEDPQGNRILACASCRSDWPDQLRLMVSET